MYLNFIVVHARVYVLSKGHECLTILEFTRTRLNHSFRSNHETYQTIQWLYMAFFQGRWF
jgi:hypothetical protein